MAGLGGLLSGLGSKLGAGLGAAKDGLLGAPQMLINNDVAPVGPMDETLRRLPTVADVPMMERKGGLLSNFLNTDAAGVTGADRMFALGSILQGDSGGAQNFLAGQREAVQAAKARELAMQDRQRREDLEKAGLEALRSNIGANGQLNVPGYLKAVLAAGGDPSKGLALAESMAPKVSLQNAGGGGLYEVTTPFGGQASTRELIAPPKARLPAGQRYNPITGDVEVDPNAVEFKRQVYQATPPRYKPTAPKAGAAAKPQPKPTGRQF